MLRDTANKVLFENSTIDYDGTYTINPEAAAEYGVDMEDLDAQFGTVSGVDEAYPHTIYRAEDSNCIVKLIHNSDGGSGTEETGAAPQVTLKDSVMAGDILNTAAMTGDEYTATYGPAGEGIRTPRSLEVFLTGSEITGAISLGQDTWEVTTLPPVQTTPSPSAMLLLQNWVCSGRMTLVCPFPWMQDPYGMSPGIHI